MMPVQDIVAPAPGGDEVIISLPAMVELAERHMRKHRAELFPGDAVAPRIVNAQWVPLELGGYLRCQIERCDY